MNNGQDSPKTALAMACVILLLPTLIIAALPNIFFGYDSSGSADIMAMTEKAHSIDAAYGLVEIYTNERIDEIISEARAAHDGGYDTIEVTLDTNNTNLYWLIAITSIAHAQDLFAMDSESIRGMTARKLKYDAFVEEAAIGEGVGTVRILRIHLYDLAPGPLMGELGFTEKQETWAGALYLTVADEQLVSYGDSDGAGYYGTDYGDIAFSDASVEVVYYNQTDLRWGNKMYGKSGTIGTSGCGPAALAIAVATFIDSGVTPEDTAKWSVENGHRAEGSGSYHSLIPEGGRHYGLTVTGIGRDAGKLVAALQEGKLAIAIMAKGHFTSSGHFIVLRGVTSDGKILVADPASLKRSNRAWDLGIITNEARRDASAGGPFWILSP